MKTALKERTVARIISATAKTLNQEENLKYCILGSLSKKKVATIYVSAWKDIFVK